MDSIADVIDRSTDEVVRLWLTDERKLSAAKGLNDVELLGSLRLYLSSLAVRLRPNHPEAAGRREMEIVEEHLSDRIRQGFSIEEALAEYSLLGRCIVQVCLTHECDRAQMDDLFRELTSAESYVVRTFTNHLLDDEQIEKRYLRLLDQVATDAISEGNGKQGFHTHLAELLDLITEALQAQCAGLFLPAGEGHRLALSAAAGACLDPREWPALDEALADILASAAAHEGALALVDFTTHRPELLAHLRTRVSHTFLALRLRGRGRLLGVVIIGLHELFAVTAKQKRRLESLARRLSLLVGCARLYEDLQAHMERLEQERELRERFVSVLAHDLRGPLSVARVAAQQLLSSDEIPPQEIGVWAARIVHAVERTDRMVRDLLDANRIRAGERLPLRLDPCDLGAIAQEIVQELTALHGERFVLLAKQPVRGIWSSEELGRAIWNLAVNGVKHGIEGGTVTLSVRPAVEGTEGTEGAEVRVHNEGPALSRDEQKRLFTPFARGPGAPGRAGRGWGLGLTLVRGCAEAHGGGVRVESAPGEGVTFILRLPIDSRLFQR